MLTYELLEFTEIKENIDLSVYILRSKVTDYIVRLTIFSEFENHVAIGYVYLNNTISDRNYDSCVQIVGYILTG